MFTPLRVDIFCAPDSKKGISSCYQFCEHPKQHKEKEHEDQQSANYFWVKTINAVKKKEKKKDTSRHV